MFTCLWLVIFTSVGFCDHHHVYIRKTMNFLQVPNTGCAPRYGWRHKHSCFSFLALSPLSQTPFHFSRKGSLHISLCLLPSHSTFIIPLFSLFISVHACAKSLQSSPTLQPHGLRSPPGSSVRGISQARILERIAIPFCRGSSQPRDQTLYLLFLWHCQRIRYCWATGEALLSA